MKKYKVCPYCEKIMERETKVIKGIDGEVFIYILTTIIVIFVFLTLIWFGIDGIKGWFGL